MSWLLRRTLGVFAGTLGLATIAGGCGDGPRPAGELPKSPATPPLASRPVRVYPTTQPTSQASQPTSAPSTQPSTQPTSTSAPDLADETPNFLRVAERSDAGKKSKIVAEIAAGGRLKIDTENVTRLEIRRDLLDLPRDRSTLLFLDGQVIEWTANSRVTQFQRSPSGVWSAIRSPERPRPPAGR